jgi:hypothetical protein
MVGSDKGGVGKTTVSRVVEDYLQRKRTTHAVFDSQWPAGDLVHFVPQATLVDITKVDDQMRIFDTIDTVTLVDIAAGQFSSTLAALDEVKLLRDVRLGQLNLAILHVIGPSVASLNEIAETSRAIGGGVSHFIVKNYINEGGYQEWIDDARFAAMLKGAEATTISIPHLVARACTEVQQLGVSFDGYALGTAAPLSKGGRVLRGYVGSWLDRAWSEFDRVGLDALIEQASTP